MELEQVYIKGNNITVLIDDLIEHIKCHNCGSILKDKVDPCPECGQSRLACPICKGNIHFEDKTGTCMYCQHIYHYSHFAEWLKVKGKCAICHKNLVVDEIS